MKDNVKIKNHPNFPGNQPFMGANKKKMNHWSNIRGHNNVKKREGE